MASPEDTRQRFQNLILAYLAGELDEAEQGFLFETLERYPELWVELEESRALREALARDLELPEPPEGFVEAVRRRLAGSRG
jgi:hypothetical protein